MALIDLWAQGRQEMSDLGRSLDEVAAARPVPACPDWSVKDVYGHQAGAATDLLAGRIEGIATDEWTAVQVEDRRSVPLAEVLDEWDAAAPGVVEALTPFGDELDPRLLMDLWHHHQDVRCALDLPGQTTGALTAWVLEQSVGILARRAARAGLSVQPGPVPAEPTPGVLVVEPYEAARGLVGRRSPSQIRAWSWGLDDPEPLVAKIPFFGPRDEPLVEVAT